MSYFKHSQSLKVFELFKDIINFKLIPKQTLSNNVSDIAYDTLSFLRFPSNKKGIKIYISPSPFVNRDGKELDPNLFIKEAIRHGAKIIIYKPNKKIFVQKNVIFIPVDHPRDILAKLSVRLYRLNKYQYPMFAVTGTKGKTTTSHVLHFLLNELLGKTGLVGSSDYYHGKKKIKNFSSKINGTWLSCLEPLELSGFIHKLYSNNGKAMVVEATSHALVLRRVHAELNVCGGIITNIGSDHLDFHKTHKNYVNAKGMLIDLLEESKSQYKKVLLLNANDKYSKIYYKKAAKKSELHIVSVGFDKKYRYISPDYVFRYRNNHLNVSNNRKKLSIEIFAPNIMTNFNVMNYMMAAILLHEVLKIDLKKVIKLLPKYKGVAGRVQTVISKPYTVIVDNAHEEKSMNAILEYASKKWQRIITLFSCTGDRDNAKRPRMAEIAAKYSSYCIATNDSTHFEDPDKILTEIEKGFLKKRTKNYEIIDNRFEAIKKGIQLLRKGDLLLVLGIGSEPQLERNGKILPWSDAKAVINIFKSKHNTS